MKGGDTDMFGNFVEDAALVGVGAYAARTPNTPGMGIVANIGKFFLYATIAVVVFVVFLIVYVLLFGKRTPAAAPPTVPAGAPTAGATREHLTIMCHPGETPETKGGEPGCRTGAGNWYAH